LQQDFNSLVGHQILQRVRHVRVFPREKSGAVMDDGHAAAASPHRLGEFQADVAAAKNDEVLG